MSEKAIRESKIVLIGAGNLAWHLGHVLTNKGHVVAKVINRDAERGQMLAAELKASFSDDFSGITSEFDFAILAVSDSFLPELATGLAHTGRCIVLHTSGSVPIGIFTAKCSHYGVLYPFQTFTAQSPVDWEKVPVCIEASDEETYSAVRSLSLSITQTVIPMGSDKRCQLHLAGILANNFTNHLVARAQEYLERNSIPEDLLLPLLQTTFAKLEALPAKEAQTGPARRNNREIIVKHLEMLENDQELKNLYSLFSDSIIAFYNSSK